MKKSKEKSISEITTSEQKRIEEYHKLGELLKSKGVNIPLDGQTSLLTGKLHVDIMKLDSMIPGYNGERCTYRGKSEYSLSMAIAEEWGEEIRDLINRLK